jgi:hypothetical protein
MGRSVKVTHLYSVDNDVTVVEVRLPYDGNWHHSTRKVERHGDVALQYYGPNSDILETIEFMVKGYHPLSTETF